MPDKELAVDDDMSFELAFQEGLGVEPQEEPITEPPTEEVEEPTEEPVVEEPPVEEPKVEPAPPAVDPRYQQLEAEINALKQSAAKPPEPKKEEVKVLSDEDEAFLNGFREEWPDAEKALAIQRKALEAEMDRRVQAAVQTAITQVQSSLAPFVQTAKETAQDRFVREVTSVHPDAQQVLPEIEQWVKKLPAGLSKAYDSILDNGTSADVVELFTIYKKAVGKVPQAPAKQEKDPVVEKEKADKLQKMTGVKTERTGVSAEADPYDFETAFAQACKTK